MKKEVKEEDKKEVKEEIEEVKNEIVTNEVLEKVEEVANVQKGAGPKKEVAKDTPVVPVIEVDTEPFVKFSDSNTIFNYEDNNESEDESFEIMESNGDKVNDFEELEKKETIEFETL